jgi:hypothetical protein
MELCLELDKKLLTSFANYIEADFLAWVMLFDYSAELITWFVVQIAVKNRLVSTSIRGRRFSKYCVGPVRHILFHDLRA